MKTWKKVLIGIGGVLVIVIVVIITVYVVISSCGDFTGTVVKDLL